MQYWPLYVLPVSFSIMLSRFIHVVADGKVSLFLRLNDIPVYILCVCVFVCVCVCVCVCVTIFQSHLS